MNGVVADFIPAKRHGLKACKLTGVKRQNLAEHVSLGESHFLRSRNGGGQWPFNMPPQLGAQSISEKSMPSDCIQFGSAVFSK
jgi:hypothetical protein